MDEKIELSESKKKGGGLKIFLIGIPLYIIQLVLVYFIIGMFMCKPAEHTETADHGTTKEKAGEATHGEGGEAAEGDTTHGGSPLSKAKFFPQIKDIIFNPSGTSGKVIMSVSVGIGVEEDLGVKAIEEQSMLIKDVIVSELSSKSVDQLNSAGFKDSIKVVIAKELRKQIPQAKITDLFWGTFIMQ